MRAARARTVFGCVTRSGSGTFRSYRSWRARKWQSGTARPSCRTCRGRCVVVGAVWRVPHVDTDIAADDRVAYECVHDGAAGDLARASGVHAEARRCKFLREVRVWRCSRGPQQP